MQIKLSVMKRVAVLIGMVALCGCAAWGPAQLAEKRWSKYRGSFQSFISSCIGGVAIIDKPVRIEKTITIEGDITVLGNGGSISCSAPNAFLLGSGEHRFENLRIEMLRTEGAAFYTRQQPGIRWTNRLKGLTVTGGRYAYYAARGVGVRTYMEDCDFHTSKLNIAIFSQDSNDNELYLNRVKLRTDSSHHIYLHPNVSVDFREVTTRGAGLALHQFSGGGVGYNQGKFARYHRVRSEVKTAMWGMVPMAHHSYTVIDSSEIAPYNMLGVKPALVKASNTRFYNGGNGAKLRGELTNCRGEIWTGGTGDTLVVNGGEFDFVSLRPGGVLILNRAKVKHLSLADRGEAFEVILNDSEVGYIDDSKNGNGRVLQRNSKINGNNLRPGLLRQQ